jgi:tRNA pseudouridine55 synthase
MDGVLVIDKPAGLSSRQVDNRLGARFGRALRIGHAGTLDPFATGVLPVMVGEGTKLSRFLTGGAKSYRAELRLGVQTDTADTDGAVESTAAIPALEAAAVTAAMAALTGDVTQVPPAYSAVKVGGRPLYKLARAGREAVAPARTVRVDAWRLVALTPETVVFEVDCGPGTYVRTLGEQLAARLGTLGHLTALRRLRAGRFTAGMAQPLDEALAAPRLVPLAEAAGIPLLALDPARAEWVAHGRAVPALAGDPPGADALALAPGGAPAALLAREGGQWRVARGFAVFTA